MKKLAPGLGKKVKVTNSKYMGGGYTGVIMEIGETMLLVQHPMGSDGYERIETCEIV